MTELKLTPWEDEGIPAESDLWEMMEGDGLAPQRWSNAPNDTYAAHEHSFHKVLYVVRGSIVFGLPQLGQKLELNAGDRLDLPAGIQHDAVVGPFGVSCLEAHIEP